MFPGQGAQFVGMALDLYENVKHVKVAFDKAAEILGYNLAQVCFNGPEEELKQTRVTQPAIFVHSAVLTQLVLSKGLQPNMTAGHSLGEYSALFASGSVTFEDALQLVKVRAELMQRAGEVRPGTMAAVIGLSGSDVAEICREASSEGVVQVANFNSPIQVVISGSEAGVNSAMDLAKERGAKRVIPLVVGGAFHSTLMEYAIDGLAEALERVEIREARAPIYSNVHGRPVCTPSEIRACLKQQLTSPVRWMEGVENMVQDGATEFYELGPGNVLTGLLKRINKEMPCKTIADFAGLDSIN